MPRRTGPERLEARRARLERHAAESDPAVVMNAAARFLELRSRSVDEVRRHLIDAAFPEALVERTVERLIELGILDDRAFATAWVESRDRARPRGQVALRRELARKGIDREIVAEVLVERSEAAAAATDEDGVSGGAGADERAAERLLARNRAALLRVADPRTRRGRAYSMLARNGFDPEVCREVSARFVAAEPDTDE
jgi:SOS response regulatory protein OraA/RecX